jgi:hypothetical protein
MLLLFEVGLLALLAVGFVPVTFLLIHNTPLVGGSGSWSSCSRIHSIMGLNLAYI